MHIGVTVFEFIMSNNIIILNELPYDKTNKMACLPSKDSDQPGHPPSQPGHPPNLISLRCPHEESLATHWAHSEDSGQTGQMPRLIWVFVGRTFILLVLSWGGSNILAAMGKQCRPTSDLLRLIEIYTVCRSACIFWTQTSVCKNHTRFNFRIIVAIFQASEFSR